VFLLANTSDTFVRYFAERGTWDTTLETFVNAEGDPTQFSVSTPFYLGGQALTEYQVHPSSCMVCFNAVLHIIYLTPQSLRFVIVSE
jgi:hypothetical protein